MCSGSIVVMRSETACIGGSAKPMLSQAICESIYMHFKTCCDSVEETLTIAIL